ncbi:unnamed protein product [Closterium sp. NIES-54]
MDPVDFFLSLQNTLEGEAETLYRMRMEELLWRAGRYGEDPTEAFLERLQRQFPGHTVERIREFQEFSRGRAESLLTYHNRLINVAEDVRCTDNSLLISKFLGGLDEALGGEAEAGMYARDEEGEEVEKDVQCALMAWRGREEMGLRSGGKDGRRGQGRKEQVKGVKPAEPAVEQAPARHPQERLACQTSVLLLEKGAMEVEGEKPKRAYQAVGGLLPGERGGTPGLGGAPRMKGMDKPQQQSDWQQPIHLVELFRGIGAGLSAVVRNGIVVRRWTYVEKEPGVGRMAEHHAWKLQAEFPELLSERVIREAMGGTIHDVKEISEAEVASWGQVDLLVVGWECQGVSWPGKGKGEEDNRTRLMEELFRILDWLQERQGRVAYLLENLDLEGDSREPIQLLQAEVDGVRRAAKRKVQDILAPGRTPAPVCHKSYSKHEQCNQVGQERRALPTLVAYVGAAGYKWEAGKPGPGMVYDHGRQRWEEPTALERELAMGYGEDATAAPGANEADRRRALGNAMDGHVLRWLIQRMWRETVVSWGQEEGKEGTEAETWGAWSCQEKEEESWVVGEAMSKEGKDAMQELLARHRKCFAFTMQELGRCKVKEMELKLSSTEPVFHRRRKMPPGDEEICKEKIKELLEAGLIRRSESEYATPTVVAARRDLTGEVLSRRIFQGLQGT